MRLFASISPSTQAREHLLGALRPISADLGPDLRWTDPQQWHLTLAFYGEQPEGAIEDLLGHLAMAAAGARAMELNLRGAGSFNRRNLWVGVGGETPMLKQLMADCLLDPSERSRQRAHLTVARNQRGRQRGWDPVLDDVVHALAVYQGPDFPVTQIDLVKSTLGAGRGGEPRYEVLASVPLSAQHIDAGY